MGRDLNNKLSKIMLQIQHTCNSEDNNVYFLSPPQTLHNCLVSILYLRDAAGLVHPELSSSQSTNPLPTRRTGNAIRCLLLSLLFLAVFPIVLPQQPVSNRRIIG